MFQGAPRVSIQHVRDETPCVIVDDALLDPQAVVEVAIAHRNAFSRPVGNAYPGLELPLPDSVVQQFAEQFEQHAAFTLQVEQVLQASGRLSLATLRADQLSAIQRVCHRDRLFTSPGQRAIAGVLYLFHDERLGGTSFFRPRGTPAETELLMRDLSRNDVESLKHLDSQNPGYLTRSTPHFELTATVSPKWNRMIWYDGSEFHGSHIEDPDLLSTDPSSGRLTLNLFLLCSSRR
jgi:hypothetical protein